PIASEPGVDLERGTQREAVARQRAVGADQERQRPQQPRRETGERAPLEDRLARVSQTAALQRSQAAVRGALVVERRRGADVSLVDERNRQSAGGGRQRRRQPVDAAADDQQIEFLRGERL